MILPQLEPTKGDRLRRSLQNLGESIQSLLGSKENLTFTWAESVRFIIEDLSSPSDSPPRSPLRTARIIDRDKEKLEDDISKLEGELLKLRVALRDEDAKRRDVLNKYLDLKGNIRVFCRVRPLLATEQRSRTGPLVSAGCDKVLIPVSGKTKHFLLDRVFLPVSSQDDVFVEVEPVLRSTLDGHNVCIFAYGQTGTGKTFTMEGNEESPGIVPRILCQLFKQASVDSAVNFHFTFSMLEVYMGCLRDLLAPAPRRSTDPHPKCLSIQMDHKGNVEVENLTEFIITDFDQARKLYRIGSFARSTAWTNANETSSRSHCLLRITIACNRIHDRCQEVSKLWLIDLGGSERLLKTQAKGQILEEGKAINLSLSALGDVISALQRKQPHIPYRNSKLTQVLCDCLGEGCKILMIVNISPKEEDLKETVCSLSFATRARGINLGSELSERAKEERAVAMAEAIRKMKIYEDSCQNIRGNIQELEFLLRKKRELLDVDASKVELPREPMQQTVEPRMWIDGKRTGAGWCTNMPRFMAPTACSRRKERMDASHSNGLGRKTKQSHKGRPSVECKAKDAKIVPVGCSSSPSLFVGRMGEMKHSNSIHCNGNEAEVGSSPMRRQQQQQQQQEAVKRERRSSSTGSCKAASMKSNRRRLTVEFSRRMWLNGGRL